MSAPVVAPDPTAAVALPTRRWWRSRLLRWLTALVVVVLLVVFTVSLLLGQARAQQADDPRSTTPSGTAALAQLLSDEGVSVTTVDQVDQAVDRSDGASTVVVANADRLPAAEAARLLSAPHARLVLLRPGQAALQAFGLDATAVDADSGTSTPGCPDPDAARAGDISLDEPRTSYRTGAAAELACYRSGAGYALLRVRTSTGPVDLVADGLLANDALASAGNASLATTLLGSQPEVVWLMSARPAPPDAPPAPTLLPRWWQMAVVQAFIALLVVGVWQGRRLGPILTEPLPVTVRAAETVEGHGRLYYRLGARDRAAAALRSASCARLGRSFGHADDPDTLSAVVAARTGRPPYAVQQLLNGPPPADDDALLHLAHDLDQLEQEANRP